MNWTMLTKLTEVSNFWGNDAHEAAADMLLVEFNRLAK